MGRSFFFLLDPPSVGAAAPVMDMAMDTVRIMGPLITGPDMRTMAVPITGIAIGIVITGKDKSPDVSPGFLMDRAAGRNSSHGQNGARLSARRGSSICRAFSSVATKYSSRSRLNFS